MATSAQVDNIVSSEEQKKNRFLTPIFRINFEESLIRNTKFLKV